MSLFDNKEETLAIELTPHGKNLLNLGKFKPVYYTFHDDDIIYDPKYISMDISEAPKDIFGRLTIDSVYLKPQARYVEVLKNTAISDADKLNFNIGYYPAGLPIGTSDTNSPYVPAWNLKFTNGKIDTTNSIKDRTYKESHLNIKVPFIVLNNLNVTYKPEIDKNILYNTSSLNLDGQIYTFYREEVLLELEEINVANSMENFEFEIFIEEPAVGYRKIPFIKPPQIIVNNILLDDPIETLPPNKQTVGDLFDILIDDEIDFDRATRGGIINVNDKSNPAPFKDEC